MREEIEETIYVYIEIKNIFNKIQPNYFFYIFQKKGEPQIKIKANSYFYQRLYFNASRYFSFMSL